MLYSWYSAFESYSTEQELPMESMEWFKVDKNGLAKILERKGKGFAVLELIQNAWDQNVTRVDVTLEPIKNRPCATLIVTDDDPDGFEDLKHAYTLFAESPKKGNPEQRGVFDMGEKLVLSLCESAVISTKKGTVAFDSNGRHNKAVRRESGSQFYGIIKMKRDEYEQALEITKRLIPPQNIETYINEELLPRREPVKTFESKLPTVCAKEDGVLFNTTRTTTVEIYEPEDGEEGTIYEMGIPVVATGDKYHYNVCQKVPLNMDRDNVTPAYLKTLRVVCLNETSDLIDEDDAMSPWVRGGASDPRCDDKAITKVMDLRYGEKRGSYDPKDPEAADKGISDGYRIIHSRGDLTAQERENAKRAGALQPISNFTPVKIKFTGTALPIPENELTNDMAKVAAHAIDLAKRLMEVNLDVSFLDVSGQVAATYEKTSNNDAALVFYMKNLGEHFFKWNNLEQIHELLIHEFGHHYESNHLKQGYYDALCSLGAKMTALALESPRFFGV